MKRSQTNYVHGVHDDQANAMRTARLALVALCLGVVGGCTCAVENKSGDDAPVVDDAAVDATIVVDAATPVDAGPPAHIPPECFAAAERGLTWLVGQQNADGSWGTVYRTAVTAFVVLKLETYAAELGRSPFDPTFVYADQVGRGLDYLFRQASRVAVMPQPSGDPDSNGNGTGVHFPSADNPERPMYQDPVVLMAIVAGADPARVVSTSGSAVQGLTFREVVEDSVDYLAMAQSDLPQAGEDPDCSRGGWSYRAVDRGFGLVSPDNSISQLVTLGLEYARHPLYHYEIPTQDWVRGELRKWVDCIQNQSGGVDDGGSGYRRSQRDVDAYKTGALLQQLAFLGEPVTSPRVTSGLAYVGRSWNSLSVGWKTGPISDKLAMYAIMKGMESLAVTEFEGIDWYREFCDHLIGEQRPDGSWVASEYELINPMDPLPSGPLATVWALLVLERAAPPPPIVP